MSNKEKLLTRIIRIYGFEHPETINFARLIEQGESEYVLRGLVIAHEMRNKNA